MICPKCKAAILPKDETENGFHEACYRQWILALYEELRGARVVRKATA